MPAAIPTGFMDGGQYFSMPNYDQTPDPTVQGSSSKAVVIDGTPARVAALGIVAAAVVIGFRWAGIRFNVAVSS
jgi:hypothetical protein